MRKIHHLVESYEERYVVDPVRGVVKERVAIIAASGANLISHAGKTYSIGKDGAFSVPDEVAAFYMGHPGWHEGPGIALLPTPEEMEAELKTKETVKPETK